MSLNVFVPEPLHLFLQHFYLQTHCLVERMQLFYFMQLSFKDISSQ